MQLFYSDDEGYQVEMFDHVELQVDGYTFDGEVRKIHARSREVTVRFEDHTDLYRTSLNGRRRSLRVPLADVTLIGRDM